MNTILAFTASDKLNHVGAFGGCWNGVGHEGLLPVTPEMTWEDACANSFPAAGGARDLGYLIFDNSRNLVEQLMYADGPMEPCLEVQMLIERDAELDEDGNPTAEDGEPAYQYAQINITQAQFEAELARVVAAAAEA